MRVPNRHAVSKRKVTSFVRHGRSMGGGAEAIGHRAAVGLQNIDSPARSWIFPSQESWSLPEHPSSMRLRRPGSSQHVEPWVHRACIRSGGRPQACRRTWLIALPQTVRRFDPVKALSRYQDAVLVTPLVLVFV